MSDIMVLTAELVDRDVKMCEGRIYQCKVERFMDGRGDYVEKTRFVYKARQSCKGCQKCEALTDDLSETISCNHSPIIDTVVPDGYYQLAVTNISHDWETGYIDGWDLAFVYLKDYVRKEHRGKEK